MSFRLVDTAWDKELERALVADHSAVRIVCPFIKKRTAERLLAQGRPRALQVITRFNLEDFAAGVNDLSALRLLLECGAQIRGIRNLHAKLYLFGATCAIVTSANLTESAMLRNHELGFVAETPEVVGACRKYFDDLWSRGGQNLEGLRLDEWESKVSGYLARGARPAVPSGLGDEGAEVGIVAESGVTPTWVGEADQGFVKLLGESHLRAKLSMAVLDEVKRSGCHWACGYPRGKRPRRVGNGAILFFGRMVREPNDVRIFGRARGMSHVPGRDDATPADISRRHWKTGWPHYIRVSHAEFVGGPLSRGVSLAELMDDLEENSFAVTQRHARAGKGNTNPRHAFRQQPDVELSAEGIAWVSERLEAAFAEHGKIPVDTLRHLDWPELPSPPSRGDDLE